jgi:hypothetical protein
MTLPQSRIAGNLWILEYNMGLISATISLLQALAYIFPGKTRNLTDLPQLCRRSQQFEHLVNYICFRSGGIAAVISNMANSAAHRGKVQHRPGADLFSEILKCHDTDGEVYFMSIARNRVP